MPGSNDRNANASPFGARKRHNPNDPIVLVSNKGGDGPVRKGKQAAVQHPDKLWQGEPKFTSLVSSNVVVPGLNEEPDHAYEPRWYMHEFPGPPERGGGQQG